MKRRRSPGQTLIIAIAVAIGLIGGSQIVAKWNSGTIAEREQRHLPDITLVDVTAAELGAAGYQVADTGPQTWEHISLRMHEDATGFINCLHCRISPEEAERLVAFPDGSRSPRDGQPPADWPWGSDTDIFQVPAWWKPQGTQTRLYEEFSGTGLSRGVFAAYDPTSQELWTWMWARSGWMPKREPEDLSHVADGIAHSLADLALRSRWPSDKSGWLIRTGLTALELSPILAVLPAGTQRVDTAMLPIRGRHRYFLRLVGVEAEAVAGVLAGLPMRELATNSAAPAWDFAAPPSGVPSWFAVGPGPRWEHRLMRIGSGLIESACWAAYDTDNKTLLLWDWTDSEAKAIANE